MALQESGVHSELIPLLKEHGALRAEELLAAQKSARMGKRPVCSRFAHLIYEHESGQPQVCLCGGYRTHLTEYRCSTCEVPLCPAHFALYHRGTDAEEQEQEEEKNTCVTKGTNRDR
jgi:hypothetical protein